MRYNKTRNAALAKKNAIILLTLLSSILIIIFKTAGAVLGIVAFLAKYLAKYLIKIIGLPIYASLKSSSLKTRKIFQYAKNELGHNFSRNMIIYGALVFMSFFVAINNIKAREIRPEEVGRNSGLYDLLAGQRDFEVLIQEQGYTNTPSMKNKNASDKTLASIGVQSKTAPTGELPEDVDAYFGHSGEGPLANPNVASTDMAPQSRDKIITYTVQEGDTVSQIAEKFNISTNTILWENDIGPREFIKPGQKLAILPVTGITHTIKKGDSLSAIASRYKSEQNDILEVNKLVDASEIKIGSKIVVPDGIPPTPARPTTSPSSGFADLGRIFKPTQTIAGKLAWPTTAKRITQYYRGWRHAGIDIGIPAGQAIYAAENGIVITSGWNSNGYGYYIIVDHGNGFHTLYAHASKLYVKKGERVKKGDVIGAIGSTGRSTGPHLHFEVRVSGNRVNPLNYL